MGLMKKYKQFVTGLPSKTVVFAFGRFNPPTVGHELLVKAVKKLAATNKADHAIYASKSQDAKKNPLSVDKKVHYLKLMFPGTNFVAASSDVPTFIQAAKQLNKKYKSIIMVAGSDRIPEFQRLLNQYNGKEFNFDKIQVISAGERDPDADDASGMSASKMRTLASKGNYAEFKRGLPSTMRDIDGRRLMNDVRQGMGLDLVKEQIILVKDDLREQYFRGEIFNIGDIVESAGQQYEIVKRGSNHLLLKQEDGTLVSKWIQDVCLIEGKNTEEVMLNEELTSKTLKTNDKIKVARIIATMLGVENAEASSNPDMLVNMGLRKIKTKALNPESLKILNQMLKLASEVGVKYDQSLVPTKLKEDAKPLDETEKVDTDINYNMAKDRLRYKDYTALMAMTHGKVGKTMSGNDQVRKMKIKHHLGEEIEELELDESQAEHWKKIQSMDKGSVLGGKEGAKKKLAYLNAVHDYHKKYGNDTKKVKSEIERIHRSRLAETTITEGAYEKAEENKKSADSAKKQGDMFAHHLHMADHHDNMAEWHSSRGRHGEADKHAEKAEQHHEKAMALKEHLEETIDESSDAGLAAKAKKSGISIETLRKVYRRGVAAWNSGHRPGTTPQQWGMARVNSYITKGKGTYHGADKDLREEEQLEEDSRLTKTSYHRGLSPATAKARVAHWKKMDKLSDKNPEAYKPAPGDATAETKPSVHTKKYHAMYGEGMDEEIYEACWDGYKQVGMKKKGSKMVPNCVEEETDEESADNDVKNKIGVCPACDEEPCECDSAQTKAVGNPVLNQKPFDPFFREEVETEHGSTVDMLQYETEYHNNMGDTEISDEELDAMANEINDLDDIIDAYDDEELAIIDAETGEELPDEDEEAELKEGVLLEVLSRIERMKSRIRIKRTKAKRERKMKIALKRYSDSKTINKRARRLAVKLMKKRLLRGRNMAKLSVGEKERVERMIEKRKSLIGRLALRLAPRVRKIEKSRMSNTKFTQGATPNVGF